MLKVGIGLLWRRLGAWVEEGRGGMSWLRHVKEHVLLLLLMIKVFWRGRRLWWLWWCIMGLGVVDLLLVELEVQV